MIGILHLVPGVIVPECSGGDGSCGCSCVRACVRACVCGCGRAGVGREGEGVGRNGEGVEGDVSDMGHIIGEMVVAAWQHGVQKFAQHPNKEFRLH